MQLNLMPEQARLGCQPLIVPHTAALTGASTAVNCCRCHCCHHCWYVAVGHYIKERTKNAQFVIISLRNNMFELADRLVGIYKTDNATKTVTINPRSFVVGPAGSGSNQGDRAAQQDQQQEQQQQHGMVVEVA